MHQIRKAYRTKNNLAKVSKLFYFSNVRYPKSHQAPNTRGLERSSNRESLRRRTWLSVENIPCHLRRMCILLSLASTLGICLLHLTGLWYCLNPLIPYWSSVCFSYHYWRWSIEVECLFLLSTLSKFAIYILISVWPMYNCHSVLMNWASQVVLMVRTRLPMQET